MSHSVEWIHNRDFARRTPYKYLPDQTTRKAAGGYLA